MQSNLSHEEFPYLESLSCSDKLDTFFMEKLAPSPTTCFSLLQVKGIIPVLMLQQTSMLSPLFKVALCSPHWEPR